MKTFTRGEHLFDMKEFIANNGQRCDVPGGDPNWISIDEAMDRVKAVWKRRPTQNLGRLIEIAIEPSALGGLLDEELVMRLEARYPDVEEGAKAP